MNYKVAEEGMERVMDVIKAIRARRAALNVPPSKKAAVTVVTKHSEEFAAGAGYLSRLMYASSIDVRGDEPADVAGLVCDVTHNAKIYMPLAELVDLEKEKQRLEKELKKQSAELEKLNAKLDNPGFVNKAPAQVVEAEKARAVQLTKLVEKLREQLKGM